jgi:hypothetical protein
VQPYSVTQLSSVIRRTHANGKKKRRKEKEEIKYCLFAAPAQSLPKADIEGGGCFFSKPEI